MSKLLELLGLRRRIVLLAPLALTACVGYATPEREVLWTPVGTFTREQAPAAP